MKYWFVDCENVCNLEKFFNVFNGYEKRDKVLCVYSNRTIHSRDKFIKTKLPDMRCDYCMVKSGKQKVDLKIIKLARRHLGEICNNGVGKLDICREVIIISNDNGYLKHFPNMNVILRKPSYRKTPKMYISSYVDAYNINCKVVFSEPVVNRRLRVKRVKVIEKVVKNTGVADKVSVENSCNITEGESIMGKIYIKPVEDTTSTGGDVPSSNLSILLPLVDGKNLASGVI